MTTDCPNDSMVYIGCTDTTFKKRHYGHTSDLRVNKNGVNRVRVEADGEREGGGCAMEGHQKMSAIQEWKKAV